MSRTQRNEPKYRESRRRPTLPLRESFIIFCEGDTEVGYFSSFKKRAKRTAGGNSLSIVEEAVAVKNASEKKYDHYWVVFDKDETSDRDFMRAIHLAEENNIHAAWSNQAFECWIILHYRDFTRACHRNDYEGMLRQHIPGYSAQEKGEGQGRRLHMITAPHLRAAIERARSGHASFDPALPAAQKQTCTLIYQLVESILETTNLPG